MPGKIIQIHGRADSDFDCYLAMPDASGPVPAVVLASAIHGVDRDLRDLADEFAAHGYIAAAPDLFWRTIPGPLTRADSDLTTRRGQPRAEKIKTGEADMADTLAGLQALPQFNGRAASWVSATAAPTPFSGRSGSVMPQAFHATAPGCRITSAISTA